MSQITLPSSIAKWDEKVLESFGPTLFDLGIADIGRLRPVGSASKLGFNDWLLLRIVREVKDKQPSHAAIFGTRGDSTRAASEKLLSRSDWWEALTTKKDNPWAWNRMQPWKQSANEITKRPTEDSKARPSGPIAFDIDTDRVVVVPLKERLRRPAIRTEATAEPPTQLGYVEEKMERMDFGAQGSPSRTPSPPSDAGYRYASSGSPGNLAPGRDESSEASSTGLEAKLLARHRPDEALVNMSCILLLQGILNAVTENEFPSKYDWSILHKTCAVSQFVSRDNRIPLITAKMDGCLVARQPGVRTEECEVLSIVEVKPFRRTVNQDATRMQEGAEMAAWISTESTKGLLPAAADTYRRLLISQDLDEIVITIAEYDNAYIKYIRGGDSTEWPRGRPPVDPLCRPQYTPRPLTPHRGTGPRRPAAAPAAISAAVPEAAAVLKATVLAEDLLQCKPYPGGHLAALRSLPLRRDRHTRVREGANTPRPASMGLLGDVRPGQSHRRMVS